jgi:hypothetical protein
MKHCDILIFGPSQISLLTLKTSSFSAASHHDFSVTTWVLVRSNSKVVI